MASLSGAEVVMNEAPLEGSFEQIELEHGGTRLVMVPALGGKIASLVMGGREWLWMNDILPWRAPVPGTSYVETADSGGWDECFPTVGACTLPTDASRWSGLSLPDHGELWSQAVEVDVAPRSLGCVWRARLLPARFERTVEVQDDGSVRFSYRVTNAADVSFPFLWSAHPLLPLTQATQLTLPAGARMRVWAAHGIEPAAGEHQWPHLSLRDGRTLDLSKPASVDRYAVKVFLDLTGPIKACVSEAPHRLELEWDAASVPNFGLWLNRRGWTPFVEGEPYCNLAFEPCIGAPDSLTAALGPWHGAQWLDAGATRTWSVTVRSAESF